MNASDYPEPGAYEVIQSDSEIRVLVYRGGLLGGFGHNHVITTSEIVGRIEITEHPAASSVDLTIPVESFEIDDEAIRQEEGEAFKTEVSEKDKRRTRKNMLGNKLLNSGKFSTIFLRSTEWTGELPEIVVTVEITIKDQTKVVEFPASVNASGDEIVVIGELSVTHGQLGLKPFRAALGSLRVRDEIELKFRVAAIRNAN